MPLVKFTATRSPADRTAEIRLGDRVLVLNGDPVEVTDAELYSITANGYCLTAVESSPASEPEAAAAPAAPAVGTPAPQTPLSGATPQTASPGA